MTEQAKPAETTAIQKTRKGLYDDVNDLAKAFEAASKKANLIAPVTRIEFIPDGFSIALRLVTLDPTPDRYESKDGRRELVRGGGDVYSMPEAPGVLAPTKVALRKIADAAGISWDPANCRRVDDRSDPRYVEFSVAGFHTSFDGETTLVSGTAKVDYRDGSPTIKGWTAARLERARGFILEIAEARAKNRAIRDALGLKASYTPAELARPFVVPKLVLTGETDDPELRRAIALRRADRALAGARALYPGPESTAAPVPAETASGTAAPAAERDRAPGTAAETAASNGPVRDRHGDIVDDGAVPPDDDAEF